MMTNTFNKLTKEEEEELKNITTTSLKTYKIGKHKSRELKHLLRKANSNPGKQQTKEDIKKRLQVELDLLELEGYTANLYNALLYRYKRLNIQQSNYYDVYIREYSLQDYKSLCYIIAKTTPLELVYSTDGQIILDKKSYVDAYKSMSKAIERETNISRKKDQLKAYKQRLALEDVAETLVINNLEDNTTANILKYEIYTYIDNNLTNAQKKVLQKYVLDGVKIDSKAKRRIKEKLKTAELYDLLKGVIY